MSEAAKETDFKVLVHPDGVYSLPIWQTWEKEGCKILPIKSEKRMDELQDTQYVANLKDGTRIVLGGQMIDACVYLHAMTLITDPEITQRGIIVALDASALVGGSLEGTIEVIRRKTGLVLSVINGDSDSD